MDLTPPEEVRARRIRRLILLGAFAACSFGVAIYFAGPRIGGAIKGWQSRRLAREAFALIDQKEWSDANAKARDAYLLRPTEARVLARHCAAGLSHEPMAAGAGMVEENRGRRPTHGRGPARLCCCRANGR